MASCDLKIVTERLLIKELELSDAPEIFRYYQNPEVTKYIPPRNFTCVKDTEDYIIKYKEHEFNTAETWYPLGVYLLNGKRFVGSIGLHFMEPKNEVMEIGFVFVPEYQKNGYAFESVNAILKHLFGCMGKHRVIAWVDPRNERSVNLLSKLGMQREAYFKKSYWNGTEWCDDAVHAILQEECSRKSIR